MSNLYLAPINLKDAKKFVDDFHRHHSSPVGHKFSIGLAQDGELVGVAIIGRPVARHFDDGQTLEVVRTATDGTKNANSMLYGAAWRAVQAMGYSKLITYTLEVESGSSLKAAGWQVLGVRKPHKGWSRTSRPRGASELDSMTKIAWVKSNENG